MTIDEIIKHCEEEAETNERSAIIWIYNKPNYEKCMKNASDHRQLAELLKELKAYREADEEINRRMKSGQWSDAVVYGMGKALFIMHKHIREVNADDRN